MTSLSAYSPLPSTGQTPVTLVPEGTKAVGNGTGDVFGTILDAINPLQHIPVVSGLFRAAQGTSISGVSQIAGDTLYGGLLGGAITSFLSSLTDVAVKETSGTDISGHILSSLNNTGSAANSATPLIPTALTVSDTASTSDSSPSQDSSLSSAVKNILHPGLHPEYVAGQYKRAQAFDMVNKSLLKS